MNERSIYTVAAKTEGEVLSHCITRTRFLRDVIADPRTRNLFSFWGEHLGIDAIVERAASRLDALAQVVGLDHRSRLKTADLRAEHLAPIVAPLQQHEARLTQRLAESHAERRRVLLDWIVADLFGAQASAEAIPVRAWLAEDLLMVFEVEVWAHVWGESLTGYVSRPPTATIVPKGQRPKGDGEHLQRNATWFYRARVAVPQATIEELAEEYLEASPGRREPRDRRGLAERPDTKLVRHGIADAARLLTLTIPPELWAHYRTIH